MIYVLWFLYIWHSVDEMMTPSGNDVSQKISRVTFLLIHMVSMMLLVKQCDKNKKTNDNDDNDNYLKKPFDLQVRAQTLNAYQPTFFDMKRCIVAIAVDIQKQKYEMYKEKRNEKNKTNGRKKKSLYEYNYMVHISGSYAKIISSKSFVWVER